MSTVAASTSDPTLAKIRAILALEGVTGQAGEVALNLRNQSDSPRLFHSATVAVEGVYSVTVSTEDTFFLSMRPDGKLLCQVGQDTGTMARFSIKKVDGFEYRLSPKTTEYTFVEDRPTGESRLKVTIHW